MSSIYSRRPSATHHSAKNGWRYLFAQSVRGCGVSRKKAVQREFRQRDVHRRAEHRGRAEEGEDAALRREAERHGNAGIVGAFFRFDAGPNLRRGKAAQLAKEIDENRIGGDIDLVAKPIE